METLDGEAVLFHPTGNVLLYMNQSGTLLWSLCDGKRFISEMVAILSAAYPQSAQEIARDVPEAIQELLVHGALLAG